MSANRKSPDRRVQRTRHALRDAMISLQAECGWDRISIQALCERANIGRSTFYQHFQNKEELLAAGFDDLRAWLRAQSPPAAASADTMSFVRGLIEHVYEQRKLFKATIGRSSGHIVQKRFRKMVCQLIEEEIVPHHTGWKQKAGAHYLAGAMVELLAWWVDFGKEQTTDEIEALFYQFALPTIRQIKA